MRAVHAMTRAAVTWQVDDFDDGIRRADWTREQLMQFGLRRSAWMVAAATGWSQVVLRGDLERMELLLDDYGDELYMLRLMRSLVAEFRGDLALAAELTPAADSPDIPPAFEAWVHAHRARLAHLAGRAEESLGHLRTMMPFLRQLAAGDTQPRHALFTAVDWCIDALMSIAPEELRSEAMEMRANRAPGWIRDGIGALAHDRRVQGLIALDRNDLEEAAAQFQAAFEHCESNRLPVEAARCLEGLAEVATRRGEREQAMEYLDRAGKLFSRHGARLYLDQVLAKQVRLRA
jgi:tetratricopeptide (TPR) repeat protein